MPILLYKTLKTTFRFQRWRMLWFQCNEICSLERARATQFLIADETRHNSIIFFSFSHRRQHNWFATCVPLFLCSFALLNRVNFSKWLQLHWCYAFDCYKWVMSWMEVFFPFFDWMEMTCSRNELSREEWNCLMENALTTVLSENTQDLLMKWQNRKTSNYWQLKCFSATFHIRFHTSMKIAVYFLWELHSKQPFTCTLFATLRCFVYQTGNKSVVSPAREKLNETLSFDESTYC